jgi:ABC-type branched-subunit amino acid transport system ATPase component/cytochrome P450
MAEPLLEIRGLSVGYDDSTVLPDFSLTLAPGGTLAILGRNGVGKSTLMLAIAGHLKPHSGTIRFAGVDITAASPDKRCRAGVGWVPQGRDVFAPLTVEENLRIAVAVGPWTITKVFELFPRLMERRRNYGNQLSGGEQQMLAIGRALVTNPRLLLLDEPLEGLAPTVAQDVATCIARIVQGDGVSVILVEQNIAFALGHTNDAAIMERGVLVRSAPSSTIAADREALEQYVGMRKETTRKKASGQTGGQTGRHNALEDGVDFKFEPDSKAFVDDPYPAYKILRDRHPAYRDPQSGFYLITRNDDVARILMDHETFSSSRGNAIVDSPLRVGKTLGSMDPPRHDDLRRIVMRGFTRTKIQTTLQQIEYDLQTTLAQFGDRRECEFMADISRPVLYGALGRMLGLEGELADRAAMLSSDIFHVETGAMGPAAKPGLMEGVFALLAEQLERRRNDRSDDLFSFLLEAQEKGSSMTDAEILGNMSTVLLAGNASIGHFFSNMIYALWRFPDERAKLLAAPEKIDDAIQECVRWDTSTQAFGRQTTKEVALHGVTIPVDSRLVVFYASASRDERVVPDPDRFDINRDRTRSFGFGSGPHVCLGAPTARAMMKAILTPLLPLLGSYELDIPNSQRVAHVMARGFYKLPIRW